MLSMPEHHIGRSSSAPTAMTGQPAHDTTFRNARLLKLPAELRDAIYAFVLGQVPAPKFRYAVVTSKATLRQTLLTGPSALSLAHTCRILRNEVLAEYYNMHKKTLTVDMRERFDSASTFTYTSVLLFHPAWQFVKAVDFIFSVRVTTGVGVRHNGKARIRTSTERGVYLELSLYDRCYCELETTAIRLVEEGEGHGDSLRLMVGWIDDTVIPEAGKKLEAWNHCERCTKLREIAGATSATA